MHFYLTNSPAGAIKHLSFVTSLTLPSMQTKLATTHLLLRKSSSLPDVYFRVKIDITPSRRVVIQLLMKVYTHTLKRVEHPLT